MADRTLRSGTNLLTFLFKQYVDCRTSYKSGYMDHDAFFQYVHVCTCVCVCETERGRGREKLQK